MQTSQTPAPPLQISDLRETLLTYGAAQSKFVAENPKLLKTTFDLLRAIQSGNWLAGSATMVSGASTASRLIGGPQATQTALRSSALVVSTFKSSMDLLNVAKLTSPGAVLVYVGAATVQKAGLAVSFAGGDSERAKCTGALMELAGSVAVSAVAAPTGILLALTLASLTASVYNANQSCQGMLTTTPAPPKPRMARP